MIVVASALGLYIFSSSGSSGTMMKHVTNRIPLPTTTIFWQ